MQQTTQRITVNITSLPAMQWKKYSCGRSPVRNRPATKPPARGDVSYGKNDGSEAPLSINGGRRPSKLIWPNVHDIWTQLTYTSRTDEMTLIIQKASSNWPLLVHSHNIRTLHSNAGYLCSFCSGQKHHLQVICWKHFKKLSRHLFVFIRHYQPTSTTRSIYTHIY